MYFSLCTIMVIMFTHRTFWYHISMLVLYLINEQKCRKFVQHSSTTTIKNHISHLSKTSKIEQIFKFLNCYKFKTRKKLEKLFIFKCFSCIEEEGVKVFKRFSKTVEWEIFCYTTTGASVYWYIRS